MSVVRYTTRQLIQAVQWVKANPDGRVKIRRDESVSSREYMVWFNKCLDNKINRADTRCWRKLTDEYQQNLGLDAYIIHQTLNQRVRRSGRNFLRTPELKRRYPDIDNPED